MKTALCFTGTGRSLEYTHLNLKNHLIDSVGDCDIFILVAGNPHAEKVEKLLSVPQVKRLLIENEPTYDLTSYRFRPGWPNPPSTPQIYIKMIKARERCNEILAAYEKTEGITYDRVIFSRLDVKYFDEVDPHLTNLDPDILYIPDFHSIFGGQVDGYNDRFAVGNRKNMDAYFTVTKSLDAYMGASLNIFAEGLLKWHLVKNEVKVEKIPVRFTRVRSDGEEIDTRLQNRETWGPGDT